MRVIGFAGWSGAGKTTLIVKLIPELNRRGFSVSTIKHAHHNFDLDQPGKDSYEHRAAGAEEVLVASANRVALDAGIARRAGAVAGRALAAAQGCRPCAGRGLQARSSAQDRGLSRRQRQAAALPQDPNIVALISDAAEPPAGSAARIDRRHRRRGRSCARACEPLAEVLAGFEAVRSACHFVYSPRAEERRRRVSKHGPAGAHLERPSTRRLAAGSGRGSGSRPSCERGRRR